MHTTAASKVILLTGPAGSGKTTLARRIGSNPGWIGISEDAYWIELKKGHPPGELRTPEEQRIIQPRALQHICDALVHGKNVVFEFILYEDPPQPLLFYVEHLTRRHREPIVRVLKPSIETILTRQGLRGRENDTDGEAARLNAHWQRACLETNAISQDWILDTSNESVEETYSNHFLSII